MRRLSLILSDLSLPAEAQPPQLPFATGCAPPRVDAARCARRERHDQWRAIIAAQLVASICFRGTGEVVARGPGARALARTSGWRPRELRSATHHVRLTPAGLLSLPAMKYAWRAEFARAFGPDLTLHYAGPRAFLLTGLAASSAETLILRGCWVAIFRRACREDLTPSLRRLALNRNVGARCELNRDRARRRLPMVSGLWLWGARVFAAL